MSEGHSMEIDAAQPQPVPQSDALIDGFTVPEVSLVSCLLLLVHLHLNEQSCPGCQTKGKLMQVSTHVFAYSRLQHAFHIMNIGWLSNDVYP